MKFAGSAISTVHLGSAQSMYVPLSILSTVGSGSMNLLLKNVSVADPFSDGARVTFTCIVSGENRIRSDSSVAFVKLIWCVMLSLLPTSGWNTTSGMILVSTTVFASDAHAIIPMPPELMVMFASVLSRALLLSINPMLALLIVRFTTRSPIDPSIVSPVLKLESSQFLIVSLVAFWNIMPVPLMFPMSVYPAQSSVIPLLVITRHDPLYCMSFISVEFRLITWPQNGTVSPLTIVCPVMFSPVIVLLMIVEL